MLQQTKRNLTISVFLILLKPIDSLFGYYINRPHSVGGLVFGGTMFFLSMGGQSNGRLTTFRKHQSCFLFFLSIKCAQSTTCHSLLLFFYCLKKLIRVDRFFVCLYKKKSCSFSSTKQFDFCRFIIISSKNYIRFETKKNIIIHRLGAGQCILFHILYIYIFRYCHCEPISICCIHDVMCVSSMLIIGLNVY